MIDSEELRPETDIGWREGEGGNSFAVHSGLQLNVINVIFGKKRIIRNCHLFLIAMPSWPPTPPHGLALHPEYIVRIY